MLGSGNWRDNIQSDHYIFLSQLVTSGIITTTSSLDYELEREYTVLVTASDNGTPPLRTTIPLVIGIVDENDNTPVFTRQTYTAILPENSGFNSLVANLDANDADSGTNSQLVFSIVDGGVSSVFQIDGTSGIVTVQRSELLDFETARTHFVQVQVEDMGVPVMTSRAAVG